MLGASDFHGFHDVAKAIGCSYDLTVLKDPPELVFGGMCLGKGALSLWDQCQKLTVSDTTHLARRKITVGRSGSETRNHDAPNPRGGALCVFFVVQTSYQSIL